jgi:hypothetical protein
MAQRLAQRLRAAHPVLAMPLHRDRGPFPSSAPLLALPFEVTNPRTSSMEGQGCPGEQTLVLVNNILPFIDDASVFTSKNAGQGFHDMRSITVRISAAEFPATMSAIAQWLHTNRYEPTRYKYDHENDDVLVTVDFPAEVAAAAFAMCFDGVDHSSLTRTRRPLGDIGGPSRR